MMIDILTAILSLNPNAECDVYAEDIDTINWRNDTPIIPSTEITAEITRLQTEYNNNQYQRDRVLEYPSIGDQLDMIYHSGLGGPEFQAAIKAVKDAHPKGGN